MVSPAHDLEVIRTVDPEGSGMDPRRRSVRRYYRAIAAGLVATDALCVGAALIASQVIQPGTSSTLQGNAVRAATVPLVWGAVFGLFGLYSRRNLPAPEEFRRIISAASVGVILVAMTSFWSHASLSRAWVVLTWFLALVFELATRRAWRWYQGRLQGDGRLTRRTLIVGTNGEAGRLAAALRDPWRGFQPIGYVRTPGAIVAADSLPVVGSLEHIDEVVRETGADCVFVATTSLEGDEMFRLVQVARRQDVDIWVVSADLPQIMTSRLTVERVGSAVGLALRPVRLTRAQAFLKRAFDTLVATTVLVACIPLWIAVAAAIRLNSHGPVLFRQERVTRGMRVFTMFKFRTMTVDDPLTDPRPGDEAAPFFKMKGDPRLTRVGAILRRLSIDELPQLWNVLRGDMSLVGPRPLPVKQVTANSDLLGPRHEVLAGVTGWWQINGRSDLGPERSVSLDLFYIENWSLPLDLYILLKTVGAVLARRGAY